jgi:glutamyl-tRNA reductase
LAARPDADEALDLFMKIFRIEELVEKQTKAAETKDAMVHVPQASFQS